MKKLGCLALAVATFLGAIWLVGRFLIAIPRGLEIERVSELPPPASPPSTGFWDSIQHYDLEAAERSLTSESGSQDPSALHKKRFIEALRRVGAGEQAAAIGEFQAVYEEAEDAQLREQSREALVRLFRSTSRWRELAALGPKDFDAETYRDGPAESYEIPPEPVRLRTKIGWLRIPRVRVALNGRIYEFAIDTGAGSTFITDAVAAECGIQAADREVRAETSTSQSVGWRAAVADELRLGGVAHPESPHRCHP